MADALHLGMVTYNLAKEWSIDTIIHNCAEAGWEGVELRATHAHGVEVSLSKAERADVKTKFGDSSLRLLGLGSAFEYHAVDPDELKSNIEGTKEYTILAKDVGAGGVKVRPNGLQRDAGVPVEKSLEQIGKALAECGNFARDYGVEIRLEVHGRETSHVPHIRTILDHAACDNVFACWNSNAADLDGDGFDANFDLLKDDIHLVHMRDLYDENYPWKKLFKGLVDSGYRGYCCAEVPESTDPLRVMRYYRALFLAYQPET